MYSCLRLHLCLRPNHSKLPNALTSCLIVIYLQVLFLDEPTTGLDSTNAIKVVKIVSEVAARGTTVIMSIHQPRHEIFSLLRRVLVLGRGGGVVYNGSAQSAQSYMSRTYGEYMRRKSPRDSVKLFSSPNPSDIMLDVVAELPVHHLIEVYARSEHKQDLNDEMSAALDFLCKNTEEKSRKQMHYKRSAPLTTQFRLLSIRAVRSALR